MPNWAYLLGIRNGQQSAVENQGLNHLNPVVAEFGLLFVVNEE